MRSWRPTTLRSNTCSSEHAFCMTVDARGVLWLDNPLLVLGLLSLLWVLIASFHCEPWLGWHGDVRQLGQRALDRFVWIRVVLERASQIGVVRAHVKVAMARQVEQNHPPLAGLTGQQRFVDRRANRLRRLGRRKAALAARE